MTDTTFDIVILAAGAGTRMGSGKSKLFHTIGGRSMLAHVVSIAASLAENSASASPRIVVVHAPNQREDFVQEVTREFGEQDDNIALLYVEQTEQRGTGHALIAGLGGLSNRRPTLVLNGDQPMMPRAVLEEMLKTVGGGALALAAFKPADSHGYGRLQQHADGNIINIIEEKDATSAQRRIELCYAGVMAIPESALPLLSRIDSDNAAGEYYLTDLVALAHAAGLRVQPHLFAEAEMCAVNTLEQLAEAETLWQQRRRAEMMNAGVQMLAPETVFFSVDTTIAAGSLIEPNVFFGRRVSVLGPSRIRAFSYLEHTQIGADCLIGPFCRTRPQSVVGNDVRLGNFVEVKQARIADHVRANHLSYLGDCIIEKNANIGAGAITCNYDGVSKSQTVIRQNAFVGSNCSLVAPVVVAENSIIGAGSVMTEHNSEGDMTLARNRQIDIKNGAKRYRQRKKDAK